MIAFGFLLGCEKVCDWALPGLRLPPLVKSVLGYLPLFLLQNCVQFLSWNEDKTSTVAVFLIFFLRFTLVTLGIFRTISLLSRFASQSRQHPFWSVKKFVLVMAFLLFLPTLLPWSGLHPSWDSDAVSFWLPRAQSTSLRGFVLAKDAIPHADYIGLIPSLIGSSIPPIVTPMFFISCYRVISLGLLVSTLFFLIDGLRSGWELKVGAFALLLSGFPIKYINGYQDTWCALFAILSVFNWRRHPQEPLHAVAPLVCLIGIKNEGLAFALVLTAGFVARSGPSLRNFRFKLPTVLIVGFLILATCSWKIFASRLALQNGDLSLKRPELWVWLNHLKLYGSKLGDAWQRKFQSFLLDGALASVVLVLMRRFLNRFDATVILQAVVCLIVPLLVVSLTPHDFVWHMNTTFSRVTSTGCLMLIWTAIEVVDRWLVIGAPKTPQ